MKESQGYGKEPKGVVLKITDAQLREVLEKEFIALGEEIPRGLMPRFVDWVLRDCKEVSRENNLFWNHTELDTDYGRSKMFGGKDDS